MCGQKNKMRIPKCIKLGLKILKAMQTQRERKTNQYAIYTYIYEPSHPQWTCCSPQSGLFACHHAAKAGAAKTTTSQVERFHETGNGKAFWMRLSQYTPVERYRTDVTVHNCAIDSDTIPTSSLPFSYCLHLDLGQ